MSQGLKQVYGLVLILFKLALEYVVRKIPIDVNSAVLNKSKQIIGYIADINIIDKSLISVEEILGRMNEASAEMRLRINKHKIQIMCQSRKQPNCLR